jgi:RimJ/RimL family protein N-acetyltransferase
MHRELIDVPMPIRTPRLLIRPKEPGDGPATVAAVRETWDDLHAWMAWAESLDDNTLEQQEIRNRQVAAKFALREEFSLIGVELASGEPVIWCGLHEMDWTRRRCETGFWVRKSAQRRGFATESTNALVRYTFGALGMRSMGITHSAGNEASRCVIEKLGFTPDRVEPMGNRLPGGRFANRHCSARVDTHGLPPLDVQWGEL